MSFGERLKEYIEYKRTNVRSFEIKSGLKNGSIYRVVKNNSSLNGDSIASIGKAWNDLNLNWLILGEEEMLKLTNDDTDRSITQNFENKQNNFEAQLHRADMQIELQNDMISLLKEMIEDQKKNKSELKSDK